MDGAVAHCLGPDVVEGIGQQPADGGAEGAGGCLCLEGSSTAIGSGYAIFKGHIDRSRRPQPTEVSIQGGRVSGHAGGASGSHRRWCEGRCDQREVGYGCTGHGHRLGLAFKPGSRSSHVIGVIGHIGYGVNSVGIGSG